MKEYGVKVEFMGGKSITIHIEAEDESEAMANAEPYMYTIVSAEELD